MTNAGRRLAGWVDEAVQLRLQALLDAASSHSVDAYREGMRALGQDLGTRLRDALPPEGDILVVTTVEDADFLSAGVLEALPSERRVKLFCYWNERDTVRNLAPIVSRYEEPLDEARTSAVVVIESIVSGACVVRTNLAEALSRLRHDVAVFVVAPVMQMGAKRGLRRELAPGIADRLQYVVCAIDPDRDGDTLLPGVGGIVHELLGVGDGHTKNRIRPRLVAERNRLTA